eukprot:SM000388S14668  [mRNA]  locus=s388:42467:48655:- [translate_table: standard]
MPPWGGPPPASGHAGPAAKEAAAAAAADQGPSIEDLFTRLDAHIKKAELGKAAKLAADILAKAPQDSDAARVRVVALIQAGNYPQALDAIQRDKSGANLGLEKVRTGPEEALGSCLPPRAQLSPAAIQYRALCWSPPQAYCLYRSNRLDEALKAAQAIVPPTPGSMQLEGQVLYRLGRFGAAATKYEELLWMPGGDRLGPEVKTNLLAAHVAAGRADEVPKAASDLGAAPQDSFEMAFNLACAHLEMGSLAPAEELLLLASRVGRETLIDEELADEEVEDELTPVSVQLAYVLHAQGRVQEAANGYSAVLKRHPADAPSVAIATSNLVALRGSKDLFDGLKRVDKLVERRPEGEVVLAAGLVGKLTAQQTSAILVNRFLLLLHSGKYDQARDALPSVADVLRGTEESALLRVSLLLQEGQLRQAEDVLGKATREAPPKSAAHVQLFWAQALAAVGHFQRAAEVLDKVDSIRHRPSTVATLVALRERAGDLAGAEAALDAAVAWWDAHMDEGAAGPLLEQLLQESAAFKLHNSLHKAAAQAFIRLLEWPSASPDAKARAITGLVCSAAHFDPAMAEKYEADLLPLAGTLSLDVATLEQQAGAGRGKVEAVEKKRPQTVGEEDGDRIKPRKKRKKRRPIYPKGFDPANPGPPPDPERWLPRRERSSYKPRKKDKRAAPLRGAQGAMARDPSPTPAAAAAKSSATATAASGKAASGAAAGPAATANAAKADASKKKGKKSGRR